MLIYVRRRLIVGVVGGGAVVSGRRRRARGRRLLGLPRAGAGDGLTSRYK